jgi:hypothetical protein
MAQEIHSLRWTDKTPYPLHVAGIAAPTLIVLHTSMGAADIESAINKHIEGRGRVTVQPEPSEPGHTNFHVHFVSWTDGDIPELVPAKHVTGFRALPVVVAGTTVTLRWKLHYSSQPGFRIFNPLGWEVGSTQDPQGWDLGITEGEGDNTTITVPHNAVVDEGYLGVFSDGTRLWTFPFDVFDKEDKKDE